MNVLEGHCYVDLLIKCSKLLAKCSCVLKSQFHPKLVVPLSGKPKELPGRPGAPCSAFP